MAIKQELYDAIVEGDPDLVTEVINKEIENGAVAGELLDGTMIPSMRDMGDKFSRNELYVPEMLLAARAMQAGLNIIEPMLAESGHKSLGRVVIGTVKGDLHDIGKNLVSIMLKGAGYKVEDLGVNCDIEKFAKAVEDGAEVVLCSALLTTTMSYMKEIVNYFKEHKEDVKIVIGGAPVSEEYANTIGAHGYGEDANAAIKAVDLLFNK
jgi:5-methyltetrahydrofolate--homocysteine methyltransferase